MHLIICRGEDGFLTLAPASLAVSEHTYERYTVLSHLFIKLGVDEKIAENDGCKIQYLISSATFDALKRHLNETL